MFEIWGSYNGDYWDYCLMQCDAMCLIFYGLFYDVSVLDYVVQNGRMTGE